jgi:uncharacterized membrane protein YqhA
MATSLEERALRPLRPLPNLIFASRWLQLPLYLGLIIAQAVYVWLFWQELYYLLLAAFGSSEALNHVLDAVTVEGVKRPPKLDETVIMLVVLGLIDVVMISNLLIMVIVGGYETFVSRLHLEGHPDQPEWLSHVNASVLPPFRPSAPDRADAPRRGVTRHLTPLHSPWRECQKSARNF